MDVLMKERRNHYYEKRYEKVLCSLPDVPVGICTHKCNLCEQRNGTNRRGDRCTGTEDHRMGRWYQQWCQVIRKYRLESENETGVTEEAIDAPEPKVTGKVDILNGEIGPKGDSRPREVWDLTSEDYSFSGKFYEYTYTFYQFRPNSDGELRVRIDASEVNGNTTTLYYTLYDSDDDEALSVNLGEYSSWETTRRISNLDTSETYYIKFHKPDDGYRIKATGTVSHP